METTAKPDPDAFEDYNEYVEALTEYKVNAAFGDADQDGPPETEDTNFGDNFTGDMQSHFKEREQDRQAEREQDKADMEKLVKHTTKSGKNFKSLADAMLFNDGKIPESLGPGSPDPVGYGPDQLDKFRSDRAAYARSGGQRLSGGITAFEDDPHAVKRRQLMVEDKEWAEKEAIAKEEGKTDDLDRARYFRKDIGKQMRALPEPPAFRHQRDLSNKQRRDSLQLAFDPETAGADWWDGDRMKQDAATLAAEHIIDSDDSTIFLPAETSRFGNPEPFTPKSAVKFDALPQRVLAQIRQAVRETHSSEPNVVFRAAWSVLNKLGYAHTGKPAIKKQEKKVTKKDSMSGYRKNMSARDFDEWRQAHGAQPY